jgi:H+/Cl- antiporter ClcA
MADAGTQEAPSTRTLLALSVPAVLAGVVSALILYALDTLSGALEGVIWKSLPAVLGVDAGSRWWIFGVLTLTGMAVGLSVWLVPGHGGRDTATTELIAPPQKLATLPSLALVTVLGLAGGVSLGPENPIIALNTAMIVALVAKLWPRIPAQLAMMTTAAGTIGALFGTPVAAALVFTGIVAALKTGGALWDRLFLPLAAAAAGALTMTLLDRQLLAVIKLPPLGAPNAFDIAAGVGVAVGAVLVGLIAVFAFPFVHQFFHGMKNPVIYITLGGMVLGTLGAIGGPLTLFKGAEQTEELVANQAGYSLGQLVLIAAVKIVALVIAASAGFRGGRIFPAVFIGATVGLIGHELIPSMPLGLAIASGTLGVVLAVARDGWISLFLAVAIVGDVSVLPVLCLAILPTWLIVSRAPQMLIRPEPPPGAGVARS